MNKLQLKLTDMFMKKIKEFESVHPCKPDMICVSERLFDAMIAPERDLVGLTVNITNADDPNHVILMSGEDGNHLSFFIKDKEIEEALLHANII